MPDLSQLPYLLKLLDDDSPEIRQQVMDQLESYGQDLSGAVKALSQAPSDEVQQELNKVLARIDGVVPRLAPRLFRPGQLVRHVRYDYRGLVVGFDLSCQADDEWCRANQTQPDRNQPWYHVLVHNTSQVTYAAQSSLKPEPDHAPIIHPLLDAFFSAFGPDGYLRNDRPWPLR